MHLNCLQKIIVIFNLGKKLILYYIYTLYTSIHTFYINCYKLMESTYVYCFSKLSYLFHIVISVILFLYDNNCKYSYTTRYNYVFYSNCLLIQ